MTTEEPVAFLGVLLLLAAVLWLVSPLWRVRLRGVFGVALLVLLAYLVVSHGV